MPDKNFTDESSLTTSQKVVATVVGALVIAFFILLIIGSVRLVSRFREQNKPAAPTVSRVLPTDSSDKTGNQVVNDTKTNYQNMPATGPAENMIALLLVLTIIGFSSIAISKRIF